MPRKRPAGESDRPTVGPLEYKVVELSTVDEGTLERTFNEWSRRGWTLDGVQFAMRESSRRPAMAFVYFTREGPSPAEGDPGEPPHAPGEAQARLVRLARGEDEAPKARASPVSAYERLRQLAGEDDLPEEEGLTLEPGE